MQLLVYYRDHAAHFDSSLSFCRVLSLLLLVYAIILILVPTASVNDLTFAFQVPSSSSPFTLIAAHVYVR